MAETIIERDALDQYKSDMVRYSIETNRRRAFPDYKDGFKLCHRRILYVMAFDVPCYRRLVKSAQVTGKVMGEYHPHGDTSIYDAIVPMANWYDTYVPLVYSESNMGSMQGDRAAAPRYTEVMLSEFAKEAIFNDMKETPNIVDWTDTYSGDKKEPVYLPVAIPLVLINGTYGIGTGKQTSIPPHNINEVIDATLKLMDNPNAQIVLVPDQCMPCQIIDTNWKQICNSGSGKFRVRGIIDIETADKGKKNEHYVLVVKSLPDMVIIDDGKEHGVLNQINDLANKGRLPQITKLEEDSQGKELKFKIHLKPGSDPNYVRDYLYKATNLEKAQSVNFEVLDDIELVRFSYKSYLQAFIDQRKITKFRKYCIDLQDARTSLHEKEICIMLIQTGKVDEVYKKIRKSRAKNDPELLEWLMKFLNITDLQAKFIINYPLKKLTPAHLKDYQEEAKKFKAIESHCMDMILDEKKVEAEIREELLYFKKKYGFKRKSVIISEADVSNIPKGTFNVVITENNYIKKLPENELIGAYKGDNPMKVIKIENTSDLILFTSSGRAFKIPVSKIPITEKNSIGMDVRILIKGISSEIVGLFDSTVLTKLAKSRSPKYYAVICTEKNCIKKLDLDDVTIATPGGIIMTRLNEGDQIKSVVIAPNMYDVVIYSKKKALRCNMKSIPNYKRTALGVYAMNTKDDLDGVAVLDPSATDILVVTESGRVNKFDISGLSVSDRYKAGNTVIKLGKTDTIHSMFGVNDNMTLHILTKNSRQDIAIKDIPRTSSISAGNKTVPLRGDILVKVTVD